MKRISIFLSILLVSTAFFLNAQTSSTLFIDWSTITLPATGIDDGTQFANGKLRGNIAYDLHSMKILNGRLKISVDSKVPVDPAISSAKYSFRSEFTEWPWNINLPQGTEQWAGWSYYFPSDYIRAVTPISIHQNHADTSNPNPSFELELTRPGQLPGALGGEIQVVNCINLPEIRVMTTVRPNPGDRLDVIAHVVHDRGTKGLLEFWFNGKQVYSKTGDTIYPAPENWGGNNKWGVYHHEWTDPANVLLDIAAGHTKFELQMGNLRQITRSPSDPNYRKDAKAAVDPLQDITATDHDSVLNSGNEIEFVVSPVPVIRGEDITIKTNSVNTFEASVLNLTGQRLKQFSSRESLSIKTTDMSAGMYLISCMQDGQVINKRVIILD